MAQRLAVLLAVASILIVACAADEAATYKYEKKSHSKHEKYDKPEHKEYKPEHKEYKPDGYKPDGYKPDGYKPDYPKPGYGKEYEHYGEHSYPHYGGHEPTYVGKPYEPHGYEGYAPSSYGYESYGEPSPYDGGYWGGPDGRQIIHLQTILDERLINGSSPERRGAPVLKCEPDANGQPKTFPFCLIDLGLYCGLRHHDSYSSYGGEDYATGSKGPIFKTPPKVPTPVGKAFLGTDLLLAFAPPDLGLPAPEPINLVIFNKNQKGYKVADVNGYINLAAAASQCHPLLGPNTAITFNDENVPVYLIWGKIEYPVDPAVLLPLGGFYLTNRQSGSAKLQSADTAEYKTGATKSGTQYSVSKDHAYVYNEQDNTLCGIALVARGDVKLEAPPASGSMMNREYAGTIEWPLIWTDLVTTVPLLAGDLDGVSARQGVFASIVEVYLEQTFDRIAAMCKSTPIPWMTPGLITIDVSPVPTTP